MYGRRLRDHLPTLSDALRLRPEWITLAEDRKRALAKRHLTALESYNIHTRHLPDLEVGDCVMVQNQTGTQPGRWDKTGVIVEVHPHNQYVIRMDGSGRCSLRNRRFLRRCLPFVRDSNKTALEYRTSSSTTFNPESVPSAESQPHDDPIPEFRPSFDQPQEISTTLTTDVQRNKTEASTSDVQHDQTEAATPEIQQSQTEAPSRRSQRARKPRRTLSPCLRGKSHNITCRP